MICAGSVPSGVVRTSAFIAFSGSATRRIGLRVSDSSPVIVEENRCPASTPSNRRAEVPEFPRSRSPEGADKPFSPAPLTLRLSPSRVISTPICRNAAIVARVSALSRKPSQTLVPSASDARITALCEMDLSPGTRTLPCNAPVAGLT